MHRFLTAVVLGTALLAGGGAIGSASARPVGDHAAMSGSGRPALVTPVRNADYREYREAPPPRHWHHPEPRWHEHSWHERHDGYRYGSRW